MRNKALQELDINRPYFRNETEGGVSLQDTDNLKDKLLHEVMDLTDKLEHLKLDQATDFSLIQTYKEMIHGRRALYKQLSR